MGILDNQLDILGAAYGLRDVRSQVAKAVNAAVMPNSLSIAATNQTFGDSWPGVPKTLTIVFRFGSDGRVLVKTAREGETLSLGAGDYQASREGASIAPPTGGDKLIVWGASYGPADVTAKVRSAVGADQTLQFAADNATFGDSWPGVPKTCVVVTSYRGTPLLTQILTEGSSCSALPGEDLQILGAAYGKRDVTAVVAGRIDRRADPNTLSIAADNATFGDSWPGVPKTLTVVFRYGSDGAPAVKTAREGQPLAIGEAERAASRRNASCVCPAPGLLTVFGASYGPAVATDQVNGRIGSDQKLAFTADNAMFGDSWPGVPKTCVLVSAYGGAPARTAIVQEGSPVALQP
jgi:hypothetical protein